jgi:hypothetical protein
MIKDKLSFIASKTTRAQKAIHQRDFTANSNLAKGIFHERVIQRTTPAAKNYDSAKSKSADLCDFDSFITNKLKACLS